MADSSRGKTRPVIAAVAQQFSVQFGQDDRSKLLEGQGADMGDNLFADKFLVAFACLARNIGGGPVAVPAS